VRIAFFAVSLCVWRTLFRRRPACYCSFPSEQKTNLLDPASPPPPDEILSHKELAEWQSRLSMMATLALQDFYESAYIVCRIGPGHFTSEGASRAGHSLETAEEVASIAARGLQAEMRTDCWHSVTESKQLRQKADIDGQQLADRASRATKL
jgi:hypothetical protein